MFSRLKRLFSAPAAPAADPPARSDADPEDGLARASAHWGERARAQAAHTIPSSWTECPVVIREYMNPLISGAADVGWLEAVAREYFANPVPRALSLGCGGGGLERHGLQLRVADTFDAFDVSADAVALARTQAEASGQAGHIHYAVADLNRLAFSEAQYGAVFASQSVHHIQALEHYMGQVHRALVPGGLFICNEFIGPNQFQWTDRQLYHANRLLQMIPRELRQLIREPGVKDTIDRPTIDYMNGYDPTEAIRSADIVAAVQSRFALVSRRDFGGTLLHLVLDNIAGNLSNSESGLQLLRHFFAEEQRLIAAGELASDFSLIVARKA